MKKTKIMVILVLIMALVVSMTSCYIISPQRMKDLKGTYKLTRYTYIPSHERKEGRTPTTYDYVNDEKYKYEDYLVITGSGTGYYAHRDASGDAYVKEIRLSYEYNQEKSSHIDYVIYNDALTQGNTTGGTNKLGVSGKTLNYSLNAFDYTELFTKRPMRSEDRSIRWEKVDNATDLSYVTEQMGDLKSYSFDAFALRGIYKQAAYPKQDAYLDTEAYPDDPYQYYFFVIDTADGIGTAKVCYALKETPAEQVRQTLPFHLSDDGRTLTIGEQTWSASPSVSNIFIRYEGNIEWQLYIISNSVTDAVLDSLVQSYLPAENT